MAEQSAAGRWNRRRKGGEVAQQPQAARGKISAGDPAFDRVLGGGLPCDSLHILAGPPGAGKTIMAQQIAFAAARAGSKVVYFTNVSEPHAKLVEHMRRFGFYEADLVGDRILIYNITSQIRNKGFGNTLDFIVDTVRGEKVDLVIVDSFRGLKHILDVSSRERVAIFDLAAQLSILNCTSVLVGEYTPHEIQADPEFAIADGIINLQHTSEGIQERRTLRVTKMRGVAYLGGEHTVAIDSGGLHVYPRQETIAQAPMYRAIDERVSIGLAGLDEMMYGGPIRSSSTLIAGSAGAGKTVLSLHFLAAGARRGERGLMVSFQENPEQLALRAGQFGLAEQLDIAGGRSEILFLSPIELDLDIAAARIREAIESRKVERVVIDSVAELEFAARNPKRFDNFLASLIGFLRGHEVTTLMTRELTQLFGNELNISSRGLSYIVDNIVLLRYLEIQAEIRRAITVLKIRGSNHDKALRELLFTNGAVAVGERFTGLAGLMTGMPRADSSRLAGPGGDGEER